MSEHRKSKHILSLERTKLGKRAPSWILFTSILVIFLVVPLISTNFSAVNNWLRGSSLPSDNFWLSGELSNVHQLPSLNENCDVCHVKAFEMVNNSSCLGCHKDIEQHFDVEEHSLIVAQEERCASCHREHEQPANLIRQDDKLCLGCHENLSLLAGAETDLRPILGFGQDHLTGDNVSTHPAFKISMLRPTGSGVETQWSTVREALEADPTEVSNLTFPHSVHLHADGIDSPDGKITLDCGNCHTPDASGKFMQDVQMETHCRSCHALVFDSEDQSREVPHGKPELVLLMLEEYYARKFLLAELGRQPTPKELRAFMLRRPGRELAERGKLRDQANNPWQHAFIVATQIFEKTTCTTCHEITVDPDSNQATRWQVNPIKLTQRWLPKSEFDHSSHRTFSCSNCHTATSSEFASDILMPDIDACETCHTGSRTHESKLASSCVSCHGFHHPEQDAWEGESLELPSHIQVRQSNLEPSNQEDTQ